MGSPWSNDWHERVSAAVAELGFETLNEYVLTHRREPFGALAKRLGNDIAHVQVQRMYLEEAIVGGFFLDAAAECLARTISEVFPKGWGIGVRLDYKEASVIATWVSDMQHRAQQHELSETQLNRIAAALVDDVCPPKGWLPEGGQDENIVRAFGIAAR